MKAPSAKVLARRRLLHEVVHGEAGAAARLHVDPARLRLGPRGRREIAGAAALDQRVERRVPLVAPHQPVDVVVADLILDHRVDPRPVAGVRGRGLAREPPQRVHLHRLRQRRDLHRRGRAVARVLEEGLHQFDVDLHPPRMRRGDHHLQDVLARELRIARAVVGHEGVAVEARVGVEIGAAPHLVGLGHAVVGPAVERVADRPPGLQPQPGHGPQHQDVHAHPVLERVEHRLHPFVDEGDRADLDARELLGRIGAVHAAALAAFVKEAIRSIATLIRSSGWR
jgi:hypothetical protein